MEDVLEVYQRPYDAEHPVVCLDETSKQLVSEKRVPIPMTPGYTECYDNEYERCGVENIFMVTEPLAGWRKVTVTKRHTKIDWAHQVRRLLEEDFPKARCVTMVCDNLNTHRPASLYEAFDPAHARRLLSRLELVFTPKHGSWLNIAEIEFSVLSRQCLARRIATTEELVQETQAWQRARNVSQKGVDWQFTTDDARVKLKRLYPQIIS